MKWLPARPTVYRGIRMRSRLEADFARWLDSPECDWLEDFREWYRWDYEPECFADETGQYLPDFRIDRGADPDSTHEAGRYEYIEVKPLAASKREDFTRDDPIEGFLGRMEIVWASRPEADLRLVFWQYKATAPFISFRASGWEDRLWMVDIPGVPWSMRPLLWSGHGQWADLSIARGYKVFSR